MKTKLHQIGITVPELSNLLLLPEQTIYSWFKRKNSIPLPYSEYIAALEVYQNQKNAKDLVALNAQWTTENKALLQIQKTNALKALQLKLQQSSLALQKLKIKENQLLKRIHLSQNYPKYLKPELQNSESQQSWCSLIGRKSAFNLGDIVQSIQKLEQKIAGVEAEIGYWENTGL